MCPLRHRPLPQRYRHRRKRWQSTKRRIFGRLEDATASGRQDGTKLQRGPGKGAIPRYDKAHDPNGLMRNKCRVLRLSLEDVSCDSADLVAPARIIPERIGRNATNDRSRLSRAPP